MRLTHGFGAGRFLGLRATNAILVLTPLLLISACGSGLETANGTAKSTTSASAAPTPSLESLSASSKHPTQYSFEFFDPPGSTNTQAWGINDFGTVVGEYEDAAGTVHGFVRSKGGSITTIDVDGAIQTEIFGNNDLGDIVGTFFSASGDEFGFMRTAHGATTVIDFKPFPGTAETYVGAINNRREMVGSYYGSTFTNGSAFLLRDGNFTPLADPPGSAPMQNFAGGINDFGVITGNFLDANGGNHGYVKIGAHYRTVDFPGGTSSALNAVNDLGQAAGFYVGADGFFHGFTFDTIKNLPVPYDCPLGYSTVGFGINNRGQIAGGCRLVAGGARHGFIATPLRSGE
jgi:hypothetical protein